MEGENLLARFSKPREGEDLKYERDDEKIDVEIRDIIRIKPQDFAALKNSFEEWAAQWD